MSLAICKRCGAETRDWTGTCSACGGTEAVAVATAVDSLVGRTVKGRFKLTKKIGQGGMGTVYEAEDQKLGTRSAVKFLNPELSRNVELARRFLSEARTYARISHPGAVTLHDFGQDDDGTLYIAMEFVEGRNLKDLLDERRRLPMDEALDITLQVANVLHFAHDKGVVHRDLKPENVMVRRGLHGYHVKLLDFGVARRTYEGATRLTAVGAMAGTPRYMAPEQVRGEEVDGRVDVYALGLLTFELITGVPAVDAPDVQQMMAQQLSGGLRSLGAVDPRLANPTLDAVLARATHKDRAIRFTSMADLAGALRTAISRTNPANALDASVLAPLPPDTIVPAPSTDLTFPSKATPIPLATPQPATVQNAAPRSSRGWGAWVAVALLVGVAAGAAGWARRTLVVTTVVSPPPAACPALTLYEPELRDLPLVELERQFIRLPLFPPSTARKQVTAFKVQTESYAEGLRDCMYRTMLIASIASSRTAMKTTPELWGHTREVGRLKSLLLEMPMRQGFTLDQRAQLIEQIERFIIPSLTAEDEADKDYWRQQYYGIELLCEVTDEGLAELRARRPGTCLNLKPN